MKSGLFLKLSLVTALMSSMGCSKSFKAVRGTESSSGFSGETKFIKASADSIRVVVSEPAADAIIQKGTTVTIRSEVQSPVSIYRADIYVNGEWLCGDYDYPWTCDYKFEQQGEYKIQAVAYNDAIDGLETLPRYSESIQVRVVDERPSDPVLPPKNKTSVNLNLPDETNIEPGKVLQMTADASLDTGVYRVDFHVDGQIACIDYDFPWNCDHLFKSEGVFQVVAVAYDRLPTYSNKKIVTVSRAQQPLPPPPPPFCQITVPSCTNYPQYKGTFSDSYAEAHASPERCVRRAEEYYRWCSDGSSAPIAPITVSFVQNSVALASATYPQSNSACWVNLPDGCPNYPTLPKSLIDGYDGSNLSANRCAARAAEYHSYCGARATTQYYVDGQQQTSTTVPPIEQPQVTGCEITLPACARVPSAVGTFLDTYDGAGTNPNRCLARAEEYHRYCAEGTNEAAAKVTATFKSNGVAQVSKSYPQSNGLCFIAISGCGNRPDLEGKAFSDTDESAHDNLNTCYARANNYIALCGSRYSIHTKFLDHGTCGPAKFKFSMSLRLINFLGIYTNAITFQDPDGRTGILGQGLSDHKIYDNAQTNASGRLIELRNAGVDNTKVEFCSNYKVANQNSLLKLSEYQNVSNFVGN